MSEYSPIQKKSIAVHEQSGGKLSVESLLPVSTAEELSIAYSPGIAGPSLAIADEAAAFSRLTSAAKTVAVISDGSAVLGLGNLGAQPAMPVMEGKCALFKAFAGVNAFPLVLNTQDPDEIVETVVRLAPSFGGINLEDIAAPQCFEIERRLQEQLSIPVFHDDQHGTAIVVLAGLLNALAVTGRSLETIRVVISGAGAAGHAIARLLVQAGVQQLVVADSRGVLSSDREGLPPHKQELVELSVETEAKTLEEALVGADVFVGVSVANVIAPDVVATMADDPIVFALANPTPEVDPEGARAAGAAVVATGRSDLPNQVNNVLAFPGIFKGLFEANLARVTDEMKLAAARAVAALISSPTAEKILPTPFEDGVAEAVAEAVKSA